MFLIVLLGSHRTFNDSTHAYITLCYWATDNNIFKNNVIYFHNLIWFYIDILTSHDSSMIHVVQTGPQP